MKVLHVLHHSVPYLDGYCIRSKQIVDFQRSIGLDVEVLTSAQHEIEVNRPADLFVDSEVIDGVVYHRTPMPQGLFTGLGTRMPFARRAMFMSALGTSLRQVLREDAIDIVHAHSPVLCGMPALKTASGLGIPMVYEVRGFWEDGFLTQWRRGTRSWRYRLSRYLETRVFRGAHAVIAISQHMLDDIAARGIPPTKLFRVPNGVDTRQFVPTGRDEGLLQTHGLRGKVVVGFIGSFYEFEGLECLLHAMLEVRRRVPHVRAVLVGGGEQEDVLPDLVRRLGLQEQVTIVGRVPHKDVARYYSVMDLLVYPRILNRTTTLTTPLKPLEAMAMGKAVVGSDVGGVKEILSDGRAGLLFRAGNSVDLADKLVTVLTDDALRQRLATAGREYALEERSWDRLVVQYRNVYEGLVGRHGTTVVDE